LCSCDYVKEAFDYFEASYNANFTEQCGGCYTDKCYVTVNGSMDAGGFGPFTTPSAVAGFLSALRNDLGGTNIRFTVESVQGTNHKVRTSAVCLPSGTPTECFGCCRTRGLLTTGLVLAMPIGLSKRMVRGRSIQTRSPSRLNLPTMQPPPNSSILPSGHLC